MSDFKKIRYLSKLSELLLLIINNPDKLNEVKVGLKEREQYIKDIKNYENKLLNLNDLEQKFDNSKKEFKQFCLDKNQELEKKENAINAKIKNYNNQELSLKNIKQQIKEKNDELESFKSEIFDKEKLLNKIIKEISIKEKSLYQREQEIIKKEENIKRIISQFSSS